MGSDLEALSAGLSYDPVMHVFFVVVVFVVVFGLLFWALRERQAQRKTDLKLLEQVVAGELPPEHRRYCSQLQTALWAKDSAVLSKQNRDWVQEVAAWQRRFGAIYGQRQTLS